MFFHDQLAAQRNHEQHAQPAAQQRHRKKSARIVNSEPNPRKISAGSVNITPAASDSPADPVVCTILFSRIVDAAESAQNADRKHRDRDRSGNRKPGAQAHVNGNRAEQQPKDAAEDHRAQRKLLRVLRGGHIRTKFALLVP